MALILDVVQFVLWVAVAVYTWQANKHRATLEQVETLTGNLSAVQQQAAVKAERISVCVARLDAQRDVIDSLNTGLGRLEREAAVMKERVRHVPETDDWIAIKSELSKCAAQFTAQSALIDAMNARISLIDEWLRKSSSRSS